MINWRPLKGNRTVGREHLRVSTAESNKRQRGTLTQPHPQTIKNPRARPPGLALSLFFMYKLFN